MEEENLICMYSKDNRQRAIDGLYHALVEVQDYDKVFFYTNNLGRSAARNTGASKARGDILVFIDQDLFLASSFFRQCKHTMQAMTR